MTALLPAISASVAQTEMLRRIAQLGLSCWCVDAELNVTAHCGADPQATGQDVTSAVISAARDCRLKNRAVCTTPIDDLSLLALPGPEGAIVADLSNRGSCQFDHDQLVGVLKHYHADLTGSAADRLAIDGFSADLSQTYEEINLLFRMARFLTSTDDPSQIVRILSDELREVLRYDWLAVMFYGGHSVLEPLRGVIQHSGHLPCGHAEFRDLCSKIDPSRNGRVLSPDHNVLAAKAGSEVIAEQLMDGGLPIGIIVSGKRRHSDPDVSSGELQFAEAAASFLGLFHQNAFRFAEQRRLFLGTLNALTAAVDAKDPYTRGHSERVALLASQLAAKLGLQSELVEEVRVAGLLHDIGKIGIPEAVLTKPAKLTREEFELIKQHPSIGYRILKDLPSLSLHLPGVLHHHERWDGGGYPHQLRGEAIPMIARILAFGDTFDAMSSNRSYRVAIPRTAVLNEIRKSAGSQFDPHMVQPFLSLDFAEFDKLLVASAAKSD